ncbi:MAG: arylsulfatase A-like enzyme [Saprospiraceae bacterium]
MKENHKVPDLIGANLSDLIKGKRNAKILGPDGKPRQGVLFITDDMITEPLKKTIKKQTPDKYEVFLNAVNHFRDSKKPDWKPWISRLKEGPVCQPCHVRCVRQGDWKLARYFDPAEKDRSKDQWEMYDLDTDPNEMKNLLVYNKKFPTAFKKGKLPLTPKRKEKIEQKAKELRKLLFKLEKEMLL